MQVLLQSLFGSLHHSYLAPVHKARSLAHRLSIQSMNRASGASYTVARSLCSAVQKEVEVFFS